MLFPGRQRDPACPRREGAVIPAAVADSWFFWLAIIGVVAGVYILPTVIAIARQVEGLGEAHIRYSHDSADGGCLVPGRKTRHYQPSS
jgi:hypothetical protein